MRIISENEITEIQGGIHFGAIVSSLVVGFVTGGPVGVGFAASGIIMAQGVDNLHDLLKKQ